MYIEDIKNDFYNQLLGKRVLVLVHYDIDAICTCKIIQTLFKCDNISYTLVSVSGISDLKKCYLENNEDIKYVICINCGGNIDIVDILQPEEDVVFFVLDAHRPTDVCNVYSDGQVRLLWKDDDDNVPNFDDIFKDDENESENDVDDEGSDALSHAVRRRERRAWEEKRNTLMFNYTQFTYYGTPSVCVVMELAWRLSRVDWLCVWCSCVGVAWQYVSCRRDPTSVLLHTTSLQQHVARLQTSTDKQHSITITVEKDISLPLYRCWSLEEAMRNSPTLAPYLKLHTLAGDENIRRLMANMGFPLQQARQSYRSMDVSLRNTTCSALESACERLKLPSPIKPEHILKRTFSSPIAATDVSYILTSLIEDEHGGGGGEGFTRALAALDVETPAYHDKGTHSAKIHLNTVGRIVNAILSGRQLQCAGPFNYFIIQEGSSESSYVGRPLWLGVCARWCSDIRHDNRALVVSAPDIHRPHHSLVLGLPPQFRDEPRNLFGKAFEQAAIQSGCNISLDYFDSSVVSIPTHQRAQFLDALTTLLS